MDQLSVNDMWVRSCQIDPAVTDYRLPVAANCWPHIGQYTADT